MNTKSALKSQYKLLTVCVLDLEDRGGAAICTMEKQMFDFIDDKKLDQTLKNRLHNEFFYSDLLFVNSLRLSREAIDKTLMAYKDKLNSGEQSTEKNANDNEAAPNYATQAQEQEQNASIPSILKKEWVAFNLTFNELENCILNEQARFFEQLKAFIEDENLNVDLVEELEEIEGGLIEVLDIYNSAGVAILKAYYDQLTKAAEKNKKNNIGGARWTI